MDTETCRQRGLYVTNPQKKKLVEYIAKHPELIPRKVIQGFNYSDSQKHWVTIAKECNSLPGAKKTWKQWKKTWQDLRSNMKRKHRKNGEFLALAAMLSEVEQEALGIKNVSSTTSSTQQDPSYTQEFVNIEEEHLLEHMSNEEESIASNSDLDSEEETLKPPSSKKKKIKKSKHSDSCIFNCEVLAVQELKKVKMKEDYLNFKKEYLKNKLEILREQTEALKSIASGLAK